MQVNINEACTFKPIELLERSIIGCLAISIRENLIDKIDKVQMVDVRFGNHKLHIKIRCDKEINEQVKNGINSCFIYHNLNFEKIVEVVNE